MGLCQSVAKELNSAVTSARKRIKQEQSIAGEDKRRRQAATGAIAASDLARLFEAVPSLLCLEDIPSVPFSDGQAAADL
eukprot:2376655-Prorocentrum_lima.AAC.1